MTHPQAELVPADQLGDLERRAPGTTTRDLSRVSVNLRQPLEDLDQAYRLAVMLAQSSLVPRALQGSAQNVLIVIMTGLELNLSVTQALRSVYVTPNGMPGLRGEMLLGKLRQAGHDYDYSEPTAEGCVFRLHRNHQAPLEGFAEEQCGKGRDYFGKFTLDDALRAKLVRRAEDGSIISRSSTGSPLPHELYGPDMMFWRAGGRAIRRGAPEITLGFAIAEMMDEEPPPGPRIVNAGQVGEPPAPIGRAATYAELQQIERDMTPAAGGDTTTGTGPAQGTQTEPAAAPEKSGPAQASAAAAGDDGERGRRTQSDPRAAGAASPRGTQPPPPQANLMGQQDMFEEPDIVTLDDVIATDAPPDPPDARSAGTPKEGTGRGSRRARPAEPASDTRGPERVAPRRVAELFGELGWDYSLYGGTVLDAVSQYTRRHVTSLDDLTLSEAVQLDAELRVLIDRNEPDFYPVALADHAEKWREDWRQADPDGYAAVHKD